MVQNMNLNFHEKTLNSKEEFFSVLTTDIYQKIFAGAQAGADLGNIGRKMMIVIDNIYG